MLALTFDFRLRNQFTQSFQRAIVSITNSVNFSTGPSSFFFNRA